MRGHRESRNIWNKGEGSGPLRISAQPRERSRERRVT
jgi:hypothetical protein